VSLLFGGFVRGFKKKEGNHYLKQQQILNMPNNNLTITMDRTNHCNTDSRHDPVITDTVDDITVITVKQSNLAKVSA
jgi:hypothetical protein